MKLIDKLLRGTKEALKELKVPLQKRLIKRGLESALDKVEGIKLDAESNLHDLRVQLTKAKTEAEVCELFNTIASELQIIKDSDHTKTVLTEEKKNLFDTDYVEDEGD